MVEIKMNGKAFGKLGNYAYYKPSLFSINKRQSSLRYSKNMKSGFPTRECLKLESFRQSWEVCALVEKTFLLIWELSNFDENFRTLSSTLKPSFLTSQFFQLHVSPFLSVAIYKWQQVDIGDRFELQENFGDKIRKKVTDKTVILILGQAGVPGLIAERARIEFPL